MHTVSYEDRPCPPPTVKIRNSLSFLLKAIVDSIMKLEHNHPLCRLYCAVCTTNKLGEDVLSRSKL